ncbi:MAG: PLDc N-terminal domain-containing protein, partial [Planctomycetaceae bacterium]|nr:PLDc N-terminal domain-containing protein [Planctomycetaceae bacterium]
MTTNDMTLLGLILSLIELAGIAAAVHAIMTARTSQGAIAWFFPLVVLPFFSLPLYLIFGRSKFHGYVRARRAVNCEVRHIHEGLKGWRSEFRAQLPTEQQEHRVLERLAWMPFTRSNSLELLVDGTATFDSIFSGIDEAQDYILIQFFIVHDDEIGRELQSRLIARAREGIRVYFLYDEIGSHSLSNSYLEDMVSAGVEVYSFHTTRGWANRF